MQWISLDEEFPKIPAKSVSAHLLCVTVLIITIESVGRLYTISKNGICILQNIASVSGDGRMKECTNKCSRDNSRQHASCNLFSSNRVSMKRREGIHLVCYSPVVYFLTLPSLYLLMHFLVAFWCHFFPIEQSTTQHIWVC